MGNNGSQQQSSGNVPRRGPVEVEQWAHSFPRSPPRMHHHGGAKVLPERDTHLQLRPTNNGEILQSGGTLSGRHHQQSLHLDRGDDLDTSPFHRSNSVSSLHPQEYRHRSDSPPLRSYLAHHRDPLHRVNRYGVPDQKPAPNGYYDSNHQKERMKRFGSEPDLRDPISIKAEIEHVHRNKRDRSRGRKKYKAPSPPACTMVMPGVEHSPSDTSNWEGTSNGENDKYNINNNNNNNRKARLFKTRAEMKKKPSPNMKRRSVAEDSRSAKTEFDKKYNGNRNNLSRENKEAQRINNRLSLPDMKVTSTPEFQAELREATKRLRSIKTIDTKLKGHDKNSRHGENVVNFGGRESRATKDKLKTLDHNINLKYKIKQIEHQKLQSMDRESKLSLSIENVRGPASGKDSTPEQSPSRKPLQDKEPKEQPPAKTFYFGMETAAEQTLINAANNMNNNNNVVHRKLPYHNSSASDVSSEADIDDCPVTGHHGIALQLRPILPKKQLEIPRFSPAAAWRLLSAMESNNAAPPSTVASDEGPMLIEDRIEKLSRPPPPTLQAAGPRSNHDKSGDSGISGDAGPTGYEDSPPDAILLSTSRSNVFQNASSRPPVMSWTPQQDLEGEEESSLEDGADHNQRNAAYSPGAPVKFSPRSHVFSLSLPRDNQLAQYIGDKSKPSPGQPFSNLQKIKRSVSGVLGNLAPRTKDGQLLLQQVNVASQDQSDNWFLSRSAPNSLNNGFNSLELVKSSHRFEMDDERQQPPPPESSAPLVPPMVNSTNGRLMYLPLGETGNFGGRDASPKVSNGYRKQERSKSRDESYSRAQIIINRGLRKSKMTFSKSCENISSQMHLPPIEPENLQDPPSVQDDGVQWKIRKPKRFTFQSTVRQIERKRLADKLSKEAERKEQQRLSELEAMQRVEEEFQRKRAR